MFLVDDPPTADSGPHNRLVLPDDYLAQITEQCQQPGGPAIDTRQSDASQDCA